MNKEKQVLRCRCGHAFAACVDGLQEDEWYEEMMDYAKKGCSVTLEKEFEWGKCECPNMDGSLKNQLKMEL